MECERLALPRQRRLLGIFLKGTKPDIFCLQETKASPEQLPEAMLSPAGYSAFFSSCQVRKGYSGVAIYSKIEPLSVVYGMGIKEFDQEGRLVGAEYEDFWLINAYFPNGGQGPERLNYKCVSTTPFSRLWRDCARKTRHVLRRCEYRP